MSSQNRVVKSELLTSLFQKAAIALLVQIIGIGASYLMQVLFARWLGAVQFGVYEYVISIGTFLGFLAGLGLPNCVLRFVPKYIVGEEWGKLRGIVWGSWRYIFFSSLITTSVAIAVILVANLYSLNQITLAAFVLGMVTIPLWALARHQREMSRGIKQMTLAYLPSTIAFPLFAIAGGFYYRQNLSSARAIAIVILSLAIALLSQLWIFNRQLPKPCSTSQPVYLRKEWFAVALPLLFNDSAFVLLSQTDTLTIGTILGTFQVGIYGAAFKTAAGVSFILMGINAIAS